ncbi:hypothetical protein AVEN_95209-1 [Araneus ventricosus]|uniref:Uncharacterized protein n=1 Tax=Araneus ventricosus TaxID=182803 RepID=A0A4Y2X5D2_ARAVE|nr:hypothetical protein AVEN_95209-1 [Araneus ventricosus]
MDDFVPHEPVSIGHNSEYFILQGFDFLAIRFSRQTPNLGRIGQNRPQNLFKRRKDDLERVLQDIAEDICFPRSRVFHSNSVKNRRRGDELFENLLFTS